MADATYRPNTIQEVPFPEVSQSVGQTAAASSGTEGSKTFQPSETAPLSFPTQTIASTVIADSLNTQNRRILADYTFGEYGSLKVGKYENGVSGELSISPNGISATNKDGDNTLTIDGTTGDATFKGTIAANSLIAGKTDIGQGGNIYIDGANNRIIINDGTNDRIIIGYQLNGF